MVKSTNIPNHTARPATRRRRLAIRAGLAILAVLTSAYWLMERNGAQVATAYGARVACSCHYLAGRNLEQCSEDLRAGMGLVMLSADEEEKSVTAWLPLFGSDKARYVEGPGCVLDSWER